MDREPLEVCEVSVIHEDVLTRVKEKMPDEEPVYEVSELFKVFGDSTRARIICALNIYTTAVICQEAPTNFFKQTPGVSAPLLPGRKPHC